MNFFPNFMYCMHVIKVYDRSLELYLALKCFRLHLSSPEGPGSPRD